VCLGDAFDDCQAEAGTCVVGAYAFGAAKERLGKRCNDLLCELLARVLDGEHHILGDLRHRTWHQERRPEVIDYRCTLGEKAEA
jgi:hypothetical protein